jgi:hypothetical protein
MQRNNLLVLGTLALGLGACQGASPSTSTPVKPVVTLPQGTTPSIQATSNPTAIPSPEPIVFPKIDWNPPVSNWERGKLTALPAYDPNSTDNWQVDLRSYDLSGLDLRNGLKDLLWASFDDRTVWPAVDKMPAGFDWKRIMKLGVLPGLNLPTLHTEGITGKKIGIAIIDQRLLVNHQEYSSQLRLYEETKDVNGEAEMHGAAVASIAVGKTVGVAPDADLYFIANNYCNRGDFACLAKSVRRIIEINAQLPFDRKIRVLSMSIGWGPESPGYDEIQSAVQDARNAGIFIICSSESQIYGFNFQGLGRAPLSDPNDFNSYEPGSWWAGDFFKGYYSSNTLLIPMDSRTTASPSGVGEYVFYREGGWSWSIPYIAGVYALAAQVKPDITPDVFWSAALSTGRTIQIRHEGKTYSFGVILDPVALIHAFQG